MLKFLKQFLELLFRLNGPYLWTHWGGVDDNFDFPVQRHSSTCAPPARMTKWCHCTEITKQTLLNYSYCSCVKSCSKNLLTFLLITVLLQPKYHVGAVNDLKTCFFSNDILLIESMALPAPLQGLVINLKSPLFIQNLHLWCGLITAACRRCGEYD